MIHRLPMVMHSGCIDWFAMKNFFLGSEAFVQLKDIQLKQKRLEEKLMAVEETMLTDDSIDQYQKQIERFRPLLKYMDCLKDLKEKYLHEEESLEEKLKYFRLFMCHLCPDTQHWKSLARGIYRVKQLIKSLDNYQVREFLQQAFQMPFEQFIGLMKELITEQMNSQAQRKSETRMINEQTIVSGQQEDDLVNTKYDLVERPLIVQTA
jgi:hypothetical protein